MTEYMDDPIQQYQYCFSEGKSTIDIIHIKTYRIEKCYKPNIDLYIYSFQADT